MQTKQAKNTKLCFRPSVIRMGFEPMTASLENLCSIQLSYQTKRFINFLELQKYFNFWKATTLLLKNEEKD